MGGLTGSACISLSVTAHPESSELSKRGRVKNGVENHIENNDSLANNKDTSARGPCGSGLEEPTAMPHARPAIAWQRVGGAFLSCFYLLPPAAWARFCRATYFIGMLGVIYTKKIN